MKGQDILSIFVTFVVGFLFGGYFYLTNAAVFVDNIATIEQEEVLELIITADVYGGCRDMCPSFQVQNDGVYRYLYVPAAGAEKVLRKGELPNELLRTLRKTITKQELLKQSETREPAVCNSYTDGIDVSYEIALMGTVYKLDSCGTAVESESALWLTLGSIWTYFETGKK